MVFGTHRDVICAEARPGPRDARHPRQGDRLCDDEQGRHGRDGGPAKLGQKKEAIEASVPNVELTWKLDAKQIEQSKTYAEHMLALKQIKRLPDFATFFDTSFVEAVKPT